MMARDEYGTRQTRANASMTKSLISVSLVSSLHENDCESKSICRERNWSENFLAFSLFFLLFVSLLLKFRQDPRRHRSVLHLHRYAYLLVPSLSPGRCLWFLFFGFYFIRAEQLWIIVCKMVNPAISVSMGFQLNFFVNLSSLSRKWVVLVWDSSFWVTGQVFLEFRFCASELNSAKSNTTDSVFANKAVLISFSFFFFPLLLLSFLNNQTVLLLYFWLYSLDHKVICFWYSSGFIVRFLFGCEVCSNHFIW